MVKDIAKQLWNLFDWLRGRLPVNLSVTLLIELIGLRSIAETSENKELLWQQLLEEHSNPRNQQKIIKDLLRDTKWQLEQTQLLYRSNTDISLVNELFHIINNFSVIEISSELVWELISLAKEYVREEYLQTPRELAELTTDLLGVNENENVLCSGVFALGGALEAGSRGALVKFESPIQSELPRILMYISKINGNCSQVSLNDPFINKNDGASYICFSREG